MSNIQQLICGWKSARENFRRKADGGNNTEYTAALETLISVEAKLAKATSISPETIAELDERNSDSMLKEHAINSKLTPPDNIDNLPELLNYLLIVSDVLTGGDGTPVGNSSPEKMSEMAKSFRDTFGDSKLSDATIAATDMSIISDMIAAYRKQGGLND